MKKEEYLKLELVLLYIPHFRGKKSSDRIKVQNYENIVNIRGHHLIEMLAIACELDNKNRARHSEAMLHHILVINGAECYKKMREVLSILVENPCRLRIKPIASLDVLCLPCAEKTLDEKNLDCVSKRCSDKDLKAIEIMGFREGVEYSGEELVRIFNKSDGGISKRRLYCNWVADYLF